MVRTMGSSIRRTRGIHIKTVATPVQVEPTRLQCTALNTLSPMIATIARKGRKTSKRTDFGFGSFFGHLYDRRSVSSWTSSRTTSKIQEKRKRERGRKIFCRQHGRVLARRAQLWTRAKQTKPSRSLSLLYSSCAYGTSTRRLTALLKRDNRWIQDSRMILTIENYLNGRGTRKMRFFVVSW